MAPYHYAKKVKWSEITKQNIGNAIARGARIALGTDAGVCPHGENLRELDHLVQLGMSPTAAIVAGTRTGAELLGIADQVGTLRAGLRADLVATDADPLREIKALGDSTRIQLVVTGGTVMKDLTGGSVSETDLRSSQPAGA